MIRIHFSQLNVEHCERFRVMSEEILQCGNHDVKTFSRTEGSTAFHSQQHTYDGIYPVPNLGAQLAALTSLLSK